LLLFGFRDLFAGAFGIGLDLSLLCRFLERLLLRSLWRWNLRHLFARSRRWRAGAECLSPVGLDQLRRCPHDTWSGRSFSFTAMGPPIEIRKWNLVGNRRLLALLGEVHELKLEGSLIVRRGIRHELHR
jgi:hypothetical protein